jgi:hypothetical protein
MRIPSIPLKTLVMLFLLGSAILAGCAAPAPAAPTPAPTIDPATYVAAAVETLSAQMTAEALAHPSATPVPTDTPVPPTPTPALPTETPTPSISATPTATEAPALSAQFNYAATYPEHKYEYVPNEKFGLAMGFLNTGSVTWEPGYRFKLVNYEGEITVQTEVELGKAVPPGEKIEFNMWAFGSETLGKHVWVFQLYTSQGAPVPGGVGVYSYTAK